MSLNKHLYQKNYEIIYKETETLPINYKLIENFLDNHPRIKSLKEELSEFEYKKMMEEFNQIINDCKKKEINLATTNYILRKI